MKYYVVSDVHGFYTEMIKVLSYKGFFDDKEKHKLIVCGDMMDRGQEALKMQEFMLDLAERDELIFIRGNHEDLLPLMLDEIEQSYNGGNLSVKERHIHNGTFGTAAQIAGYEPNISSISNIPDFLKKVRNSAFYEKLIPKSVDYFETKNYIFVHGWIPCKKNIGLKTGYEFDSNWRLASNDDWTAARWYNGMELAEEWGIKESGKTIVCGHRRASFGHSTYGKKMPESADDEISEPYISEGIIAIDACTVRTGFVNCLVIEDEE